VRLIAVDLLAVLVGCATLVTVVRMYHRLPQLLAKVVVVIAAGASVWSVAAGLTTFVGSVGAVLVLVALQMIGAWAVVVASVWLVLLVTYRAYLLTRSLFVVGSLPVLIMLALQVLPGLRPNVIEVVRVGGRLEPVWGPVLWVGAITGAVVMGVVAFSLLIVAASTILGQRPLVLAVIATTVPSVVAWGLFITDGAGATLASLAPMLFSAALLVWLIVALRHPGLVQLPITVTRLLAEVEDGVVVLTESGDILTTNAAARAMLFTGMTSWTRYPESRLGPVPAPGTSSQVRTASGRVIELVTDRLDQPGRAPTVVVTARDITELATLREHLTDVASRDPMTGARNRRYLDARLPELVERARGRFSLSVVMLDIDRFKHVNDTYGHAMGDRVIIGVTDEMCHALPAGAELIRMGGDEFAIILPGMDLPTARKAAERAATRCAELQFATRQEPISVTLSTGVQQLELDMDADELLSGADRALYAVKRARRGAPTGAPGPEAAPQLVPPVPTPLPRCNLPPRGAGGSERWPSVGKASRMGGLE